MSWKASAYIKQLVVCPNGERISRTEKLVALVLADSHQDKGKAFTFPAVKMIAEDSLMDPRVCRRILAALERKGVIERERADRQGRGQVTFYRFPALDCMEDAMSSFKASESISKGGQPVLLFSGKRGTEGGRKEDKTTSPSYGVTGTGTNANTTPPTPSPSEGDVNAALKHLSEKLGITDERVLRKLRKQIVLGERFGESPPQTADAMVRAWQTQAQKSPLLKAKYGLAKFFGHGIWRDQHRWMWDEEQMRLASSASAGSMR